MCIASSGVVTHTHTSQSAVYAAIPPSVCRLLSQALNPLGHYTDPSPVILPVIHPDIVCAWGSVVDIYIYIYIGGGVHS